MRYIVTGQNTGLQINFTYNENGLLIAFEIREGDITLEQLRFIRKYLPLKEKELDVWASALKGKVEIDEVPEDLSFDRFWNEYNYKVGNKQRAEKPWNKLGDAEKLKVLKSIPKYEYWLATHQGIAKAHATTYLNQRRWENEFK
ncbi:MAG: hypothetical protein K9I74_14630 [Bacteroidales bacterium]|nr:hypothetical protein [Bacteroidales bacterium]